MLPITDLIRRVIELAEDVPLQRAINKHLPEFEAFIADGVPYKRFVAEFTQAGFKTKTGGEITVPYLGDMLMKARRRAAKLGIPSAPQVPPAAPVAAMGTVGGGVAATPAPVHPSPAAPAPAPAPVASTPAPAPDAAAPPPAKPLNRIDAALAKFEKKNSPLDDILNEDVDPEELQKFAATMFGRKDDDE